MKTKSKMVEACTACLEIEVPSKDVDKAFDEVYAELTKYANVPGYRPGKAPVDLVKKHYAKNAQEEVLKRLIPMGYQQALTDNNVVPIGLPEISDVSLGVEGKLVFKAKVDTRPKFKVKEYKGIKIETRKIPVSDEDVNKTLENLREMKAIYAVVEDRPVRMDDYIVSDIECSCGGKSVHAKKENMWLYLDKDSLLAELFEKVVGMNKGEEKDITVVLPEKYPDKNLAGKQVTYHLKINEIKSRRLPDLSDEFAKEFGKDKLADMKEEIKKELEERAKMNAAVDNENQLLKALTDENIFDVPSGYVKRQIEFMTNNAKERLMEKGFKKEELDKRDEEFREKFKKDAQTQVRLLFILDEIARNEKIDVDDKDIKETYGSIAAQSGKTEDEVAAYYEAEDLVENLKDKIREEKTIRFLLSKAEISEKA